MKKQNYTYVGVSFIILLFGIIFIPDIIDRLRTGNVVENDRMSVKNLTSEEKNDLVTIADKEVPPFRLLNQKGDTITNDFYDGKVYVAEFFFTTCPTICPIMNQNMLLVEKEFLGNDNFGIASFSINPEHDTPQVLQEYFKTYGMSHENWNLLTGNQEEIFELANKGFNLYVGKAPNVEGGFEHSGFFALIDKEGKIRSRVDENGNPIIYYNGLEKEGIEMLIEDIKKLL